MILSILLRISISQVESGFSTSNAGKVQRSQAMRVPAFNPELRPKMRPVSVSSASSSSSTTFTQQSESKPLARTSATQSEMKINQPEATNQQQPLLEAKSTHVEVVGSSRLIDPLAATNSEHIDTARDGVFARMRNRMLRYGAVVAVGVGGGLAAKELLNHYNNNNNSTKPINATQNLSNQTNSDDFFNPI